MSDRIINLRDDAISRGRELVQYRCPKCGSRAATIRQTADGSLWWVTTVPAIATRGPIRGDRLVQHASEMAARLSENGTVLRHEVGEWTQRVPTTPLVASDPLARCAKHGNEVEIERRSVVQHVATGRIKRVVRSTETR